MSLDILRYEEIQKPIFFYHLPLYAWIFCQSIACILCTFKISQDFLLHISDLDALPINKKLTYEILDSDVFTIDPDSGIVRLAQELDREIQALYNLTIRATDQGRPRRLSQTSNLVKENPFSSFFSKKKNVKKSVQNNSFHKK